MRSSPYRAGLAGRHHKRLPMPPALLACYGPVWLSPPGKLLTQEPVFRTPPLSERDLTLGDTAHVICIAHVGQATEVRVVGGSCWQEASSLDERPRQVPIPTLARFA